MRPIPGRHTPKSITHQTSTTQLSFQPLGMWSGRARRRWRNCDEAIRRLEYHRKQIQTIVDKHLSYLSPTTRLPDEVLLHIFQHLESQLWTLSSVCKRWRGIVVSAPELWTDIRFKDLTIKAAQEAHCPRVNLKLDRSGNRLSTMGLDASGLGASGDSTCSVENAQTLIANLYRCTSVQLTGGESRSLA